MIPRLSQYTYQPIRRDVPIEDYQNAFAMSAKAYDTNLENYNVLNAYASTIKALPQDNEYLQEKMKGIDSAITSIADQVSGNQRWDLAGSALQTMKSKLTADPKLHAIRESYINFQKGEEEKAQMLNDGQTPFELTDFNQHKSINPDGTVNIYRPQIQPKADYVKKAQDLMSQIAPDIVSLGLQPSEVAGILEGKTIKGISKEKILSVLDEAEALYNQTAEGIQHRQFIDKNTPGIDKDKFIRNFLFGVGNLRTFREERSDYTPDQSYLAAQRSELLNQSIEGKLRLQKAKGSKGYDPEAEGLLRFEAIRSKDSGEIDRATGLNKKIKSNALMISNAEIINDYSASFFPGSGDRVVPINKNETFDWNNSVIDNTRVKGFALDEENGVGTLGGAIAQIKYHDVGKEKEEKYMNVIIGSADDNFKNLFTTHQSVFNTIKKHNKGDHGKGGGHTVLDTSGLLGSPGAYAFHITPKNEVFPRVKKTDGTWRDVTPDEIEFLGLKKQYGTSDIQDLTANKVAQTLKPYTKTNKDIQGSN